jgi:hypothetical protein
VDGVWLVSFMHYDLCYIDLEQSTLQLLDNPFITNALLYQTSWTSLVRRGAPIPFQGPLV